MANEQDQGAPPSGDAAPAEGKATPQKTSPARFLWELFCAAIFLSMIGLVSYNAFLRYAFRSSFPPSEEWARFLFIYVTFFGAIEAFYHHKHIVVDIVTDRIHGAPRKAVDILALLCSMVAMAMLLYGGVIFVLQTVDTYSVSTNINMALVYGTLPICAAAALVLFVKDLFKMLVTPAEKFNPRKTKEEKIAEFMKENV